MQFSLPEPVRVRRAFIESLPKLCTGTIKFTLEAREPVFVLGDFDLLVEAIANLVDNAIKFTPSGGLVSITVKANLAGFLIRVSDNGPGIAPFEREQIFKRFYRSQKSVCIRF